MSEPATDAVGRLVAALAAIDDLDPAAVRESVLTAEPLEQAGAMAGILITRVVDTLIGAAGRPHADGDVERGASVIAHTSAAAAVNQVTGEHAAGFVTTCANLLWSVVQYPTFRNRFPGLDEAMGDHFASAVDHGLTFMRGHRDAAGEEHDHPDDDTEDDDTITVAVNPTEHASIDRLTDACTALGITPLIAVANAPVNHHAVPVTALAGIITGRVALEYATALEDAPNALAGALTPIWASGVRAGITTDPTDPAADDMVAGIMMRTVMNLGKWFALEADTGRHAPAVALLLDAAVSAARTDALEAADPDALAEYIAHTGADATDEHASALDKAGEAIAHLKRC